MSLILGQTGQIRPVKFNLAGGKSTRQLTSCLVCGLGPHSTSQPFIR